MKKLTKYAFLIKHSSYSSKIQRSQFSSDEFSSIIIGVSDIEDSLFVINGLITDGIELVELCGGFSKDEELIIKDKIRKVIPIGRAVMDAEDEILLENILKIK